MDDCSETFGLPCIKNNNKILALLVVSGKILRTWVSQYESLLCTNALGVRTQKLILDTSSEVKNI